MAVEQSRLHIPLLFGTGCDPRLSYHLSDSFALAASWTRGCGEVQAVARASERLWHQLDFSPMVDIARDAVGSIIEGAGEDPFLGAAIAGAQVRGFQGAEMGSPGHVLACAKHFAGYGGPMADAIMIRLHSRRIAAQRLPPTVSCGVEAGVGTFMSAYMDLNDVPATGNRFLARTGAAARVDFRGFVVSDANAVGDLATHGFARDPQDAAFRALTAGVNMDMASRTYLEHLRLWSKTAVSCRGH